MLPSKPEKATPPPIRDFMKCFKLVASQEIAVVYNMTVPEVEREMKKLQLQQLVEQLPAKYGIFWRYSKNQNPCE
jgi:hypothetical protein